MRNKPRWEVKYEKLLGEEPIAGKISSAEEEVKSLKGEKVTGNFKNKEEYEAALDKKDGTVAEAEARLKQYKDFEKNKGKIANILEYRKTLEEKLDKLPKDTSKQVQSKKEEINVIGGTINKYLAKIEETKADIKVEEKKMEQIPEQENVKKINQRARIKLLTSVLHTYEQAVGEVQDKQSDLYREILELEEAGKGFNQTVENKRMLYERRISKCNIMAANLLKGKDLGDIELKVDQPQGRFTPADEKAKKQTQSAREENSREEEKQENVGENLPAEISEFDEKHPILAKIKNAFKNIKDKIAERFAKGGQDDAELGENEEEAKQKIEENEEETKKGIRRNVEQMLKEDNEDTLLKTITEKGIENAFKEQLRVNKEKAANELAERFGGQYERQDGATAKKGKAPVEQEPLEQEGFEIDD